MAITKILARKGRLGELHRMASPVQGPAHLPLHAGGRPARRYRRGQRPGPLLFAHGAPGIRDLSRQPAGLPCAGAGPLHVPRAQNSEDGIRAAIQGNLEAIEAGLRPAALHRPAYRPYQKHPKYTGLLALYVHYLYVLGKVGQRRYPPRMTPQLRQEVMKAERYRAQFSFLRQNNIATQEDMTAFQFRTEETLASLTKQQTILNVHKKKRRSLYDALADVEALSQARQLYEGRLSGMEVEFTRYMDAVAVLDQCGIPRERLMAEKADIYRQLAELNHQIRAEHKKLALCREICSRLLQMEQEINQIETKEVMHDERRRR